MDLASSMYPLHKIGVDSVSSHQSHNPGMLRTLACNVKFSGRNNLLHQFVLDNSHPNKPGSVNYINAVLLSMSDVPENVVNAQNDEGYCALHLAVLKNNLLMVEKLLSCLANIDVNERCGRGFKQSALHLAAELGRLSMIRVLLHKGADVDVKNNWGETALCYAASLGDLDAMKLFVSKGANVNIISKWGTPLYAAVYSGNLEAVEFLVRSGADVNFGKGWAPLCFAVESENLAFVEFLVRNGADVNIKPYENETPLHHAARSASLEIVEYLVSNGADVNAKDWGGKTPLHTAVRYRKPENAAFLLDHGADVNAKDQRNETPLHYAVRERNSVIGRFIKCLRNMWQRPDVAMQGNLEIAKLLIDQGAYLRTIDEDGKTPLHDAVYGVDLNIAVFLLDRGAGPHADRGWNPYYDARYRCQAKVIRKLLDRGAAMHAKNEFGETPLDLARNQSCIDDLENLM